MDRRTVGREKRCRQIRLIEWEKEERKVGWRRK